MTALLQLSHIEKRFGGIHALKDVSLTIPQSCIYGLIGPNGAGKTTLFNVITGLYEADSGERIFLDKALPLTICEIKKPIYQIGLIFTFLLAPVAARPEYRPYTHGRLYAAQIQRAHLCVVAHFQKDQP